MSCKSAEKRVLRAKRALRVRKKLRGTASCPRLCVVKSNKHLQAQLIDDEAGRTLAAASTYSKELRGRANKESAAKIGSSIGEQAKAKGIERVIFDRGWGKYHGVVAALADAARAAGLQL